MDTEDDNGQSVTAAELATELNFIFSPWIGENETHDMAKTFIKNNIYYNIPHLTIENAFLIIQKNNIKQYKNTYKEVTL